MYKPCKIKCSAHKKKPDIYDIFEEIKAFMSHGKYKAKKISKIVYIMETRTEINMVLITNRRLGKSLCLFMLEKSTPVGWRVIK